MKKAQSSKTSSPSINNQNISMPYEDFMVLLFVGAFLIIDFFPYFKSFEIIAPQFLYLSFLNVVMMGYLYSNPNHQSNALFGIFKQSWIFKIYLIFIGLCFFSVLFAVNLSLSILAISEILIVFLLFINFTILLYGRLHLLYKICFLVALSALAQSGKVLYLFNDIAEKKSIAAAISDNELLKGNTGNINILAASLMIKIPFILLSIMNAISVKRLISSVSLGFAITLILIINARATLLSIVVVMLLFLIVYLRGNFKKTALIKIAFVIVPFIISYLSANEILERAKIEDRFVSTVDRFKDINTQDKSSARRIQIWKSAIGLITEYPLTGVGIGNYRVESIPYDLSTNQTIPLHAHNDFLEIASETGVLNGIIYFSLFALLLIINIKRLIKFKQSLNFDVAFISLLLLVVYGVDALFNFPMYRPTMAIGFSFIMVFAVTNTHQSFSKINVNSKLILTIGILIAALTIFVAYEAFKASRLEREIQADDINTQNSGALTGKDVLDRMPLIPNVFNTSEAFAEYAGIYFLREKDYEKATKLLDEGNKINPYLGRPDFYKFIISREKGVIDSAYFYIKMALNRRPINETFYGAGLIYAGLKKDTLEMLKMYNTYTQYIKDPKVWVQAYSHLQQAGYSENNLKKFAAIGRDEFPSDTLINTVLNAKTITSLIIEAQGLTDQGKLNEALAIYHKGLALEPDNIYINQNLGFYYFNLKDYQTATKYFVKSLAKPGLQGGKTEFYCGLAFFNIGNQENGCKYALIAKDKGFPNADVLYNQYKCK